jgi:hypothetical protein
MIEPQFHELVLVGFLRAWTGWDRERLLMIYRAGTPWPVTVGDENLEQEAAAVGMPPLDYLAALGPLIRLALDARLNGPTAADAERSPALARQAQRVAEITGEPLEVVVLVGQGVCAFYMTVARTVENIFSQPTGPTPG